MSVEGQKREEKGAHDVFRAVGDVEESFFVDVAEVAPVRTTRQPDFFRSKSHALATVRAEGNSRPKPPLFIKRLPRTLLIPPIPLRHIRSKDTYFADRACRKRGGSRSGLRRGRVDDAQLDDGWGEAAGGWAYVDVKLRE